MHVLSHSTPFPFETSRKKKCGGEAAEVQLREGTDCIGEVDSTASTTSPFGSVKAGCRMSRDPAISSEIKECRAFPSSTFARMQTHNPLPTCTRTNPSLSECRRAPKRFIHIGSYVKSLAAQGYDIDIDIVVCCGPFRCVRCAGTLSSPCMVAVLP